MDDRAAVADTPAEFADWVRPHLDLMTAVAQREVGDADRDDVVQNALVRAWQRRTTYRPERGTARVWLLAILLDQARRHRGRRRADPLVDEDVAVLTPDDRLDVERAIRRLPSRQRQVVVLHYLADLAVAEVAEVLGISVGSVKSHLHDARRALREVIDDGH
jgi:RNA polymerase sigma-70 factor (ECF subfamily)